MKKLNRREFFKQSLFVGALPVFGWIGLKKEEAPKEFKPIKHVEGRAFIVPPKENERYDSINITTGNPDSYTFVVDMPNDKFFLFDVKSFSRSPNHLEICCPHIIGSNVCHKARDGVNIKALYRSGWVNFGRYYLKSWTIYHPDSKKPARYLFESIDCLLQKRYIVEA